METSFLSFRVLASKFLPARSGLPGIPGINGTVLEDETTAFHT